MTDIGELIAPPVGHTEPNKNCPFCPLPDKATYTTYAGIKNDSKKLSPIMKKPADLTTKQSGARPQTSRSDNQGYTQEQSAPQSRPEDKTTWYTHQAHHLISGKQALDGNPMEDWLLASEKNEKDTGYSVNNTNNGFWAPSTPRDFVGKWGPKQKILSDAERQRHAEAVMQAASVQIHIGPHNISDPDDPDGKIHYSYDKYLEKKLKKISDRVSLWSDECFLCTPKKSKKEKMQATYQVHDVLDRLSKHMQTEICTPREEWRVFLSKYAREYHKPVCSHKRKKI